jgi:predicted Co/Zn/Cd cation transporter (cation efflux family)
MNKIDLIVESKYEPLGSEERICMLVSIAVQSVLANLGIVLGIMAWSVQLQLDDGGENS